MFMLPKDFQTLGNGLSQAATMSLMISNIIIWYVGQKKLSVDWLNDLEENCEEIQRCYDRVMKQNPKKKDKNPFHGWNLPDNLCSRNHSSKYSGYGHWGIGCYICADAARNGT